MKNNKWIIFGIFGVLLLISAIYINKFIRDFDYGCKDGYMLDSLETENHIVFECGQAEKSHKIKNVVGSEIIERAIIDREKISHIETLDKSWTHGNEYQLLFVLSLCVGLMSITVILGELPVKASVRRIRKHFNKMMNKPKKRRGNKK